MTETWDCKHEGNRRKSGTAEELTESCWVPKLASQPIEFVHDDNHVKEEIVVILLWHGLDVVMMSPRARNRLNICSNENGDYVLTIS